MAHKLSIRKTKRLRQLLAKAYKLPEPPEPQESLVDQIVMTVLWVDASPAKARQAAARLAEYFVDWNEMRVSMTSDTAGVLEACGLAAVKAAALKRILGKAVEDLYAFDFGTLAERSRQDLRAWFVNIDGLPHPIAAAVLYHVFGYDRVLVDAEIARVIHRLGLAAEAATEAHIEAGLADVIPAREAHFIYSALRQHALTVCTKKDFNCRACPLRKECKTAPERIAELEAAAREAKKRARARARKRAKRPARRAKPAKPARRRPSKKKKSGKRR